MPRGVPVKPMVPIGHMPVRCWDAAGLLLCRDGRVAHLRNIAPAQSHYRQDCTRQNTLGRGYIQTEALAD